MDIVEIWQRYMGGDIDIDIWGMTKISRGKSNNVNGIYVDFPASSLSCLTYL